MNWLIRMFRKWLDERQAWAEFRMLPDGHPDKYIAAIRLLHGKEAADAVRLARTTGRV